jgi:enamine deaminase RidA (YjgF/YER057c/UK114 family)
MSVDNRLAELGIELPEVPPLSMTANRVVVTTYDGLAFVSGVGPIGVKGVVGGDMSVDDAYQAARTAALYSLSRLRKALGSLDSIDRWLKVLGFVRSAPGFDRQPEVVNGFSDLIVEIFGDAGRCARSAIGTSELPLNMPVEVEAVIALNTR